MSELPTFIEKYILIVMYYMFQPVFYVQERLDNKYTLWKHRKIQRLIKTKYGGKF